MFLVCSVQLVFLGNFLLLFNFSLFYFNLQIPQITTKVNVP